MFTRWYTDYCDPVDTQLMLGAQILKEKISQNNDQCTQLK